VKEALSLLLALLGGVMLFSDYHSVGDLLGVAAATAILVLVTALPKLRDQERSGLAFAGSALGAVLLAAVLVVTLEITHSWAWISFAALILLVGLVGLVIDLARDRPPTIPPAEDPRGSDVWQNLPRY
jgi:drug/metabolite transporter (DMT)-like permease